MIGHTPSPRHVADPARRLASRLIPLALSVLVMVGCGDEPAPTNVYSAGSANILGSTFFNLDVGRGDVVPLDLWWRCVARDNCELVPQGDAAFCLVDTADFDAITPDFVRSLPLTGDTITDSYLPVGTVAAYRTNLGRLGKFRVDALYAEPSTLVITWVAWYCPECTASAEP